MDTSSTITSSSTVSTIIIGGGQAGLAMSHSLTARGRDHLVLERGRIAERWHSEYQTLVGVYSSVWWRMTAPLRWLADLLRRRRG